MNLNDFDYHLPDELIAAEPLSKRDESRLLVVSRQTNDIQHRQFKDILDLFTDNDVIILNDTKVIKARIIATRETGGKVEVFLVKPLKDNDWRVLLKPAKRVKEGERLYVADTFKIDILTKNEGSATVKLRADGNLEEVIEHYGELPLPPYISKKTEGLTPKQTAGYQTVFASKSGAVAAPTAGLHFTEELIEALKKKGVTFLTVTLHVGLGTFLPIQTENILDHNMHTEYYDISPETSERLNLYKGKKRFIAVGTTVIRTLESACEEGRFKSGEGQTNLFIYPGYTFKSIDAMITNFHLPKSSLFVLVSAFSNVKLIQEAYREAIKQSYRFYSFGDAMFIE